jgi:protein gp37
MGAKTKIEWTRGDDGKPGATWNPLRARLPGEMGNGTHCEIITPGCEHCYAASLARSQK